MAGLGHVFSGAPTYFRRFGFVRGLLVGAQTVAPRLAARNRLTTIRIPGMRSPLYLRARTSDLRAFQQVFVDGEHDVPLTSTPRTIVDAGANVGFASVAFANRFPDATIIALEVDADNYAALERNVAPYPNVRPMHAGLWSHRTTLQIVNPTDESWAFRVEEGAGVPALSIPDLCELGGTGRIDLLKIDIEGAELEVLSHDADAWIDRVGCVMIELHDHLRPGCSAALEHVANGRFTVRSQVGEYHVLARNA